MLHVAPLSQDTLPKSPDTKRFANRSKTSFSPGRQNILLFIGLAEETRYCPPFAWVDIYDKREN
jgi:hypothetical protein